MGTQYHIRIPRIADHKTPSISAKQLQHEVDTLLVSINQEMSTYLVDSTISRFNQLQSLDWFPVSQNFLHVIISAQVISKSSQGAFDITVMPLVNLWGFGTTKLGRIPEQQKINLVLETTGYQSLQTQLHPPAIRKLKPELSIDLSAIAKGYAVDAVTLLLKKQKFKHFLIEIGGEVRVQGKNKHNKQWRIAIEKPETVNRTVQQGLTLNNIAVATSGDYRNYYEKDGQHYSHTINPNTGKPIHHKLASVTVLNESAMIADAQATALMVLGEKKGKIYAQQQKLKVYMIFREGNHFLIWHNVNNEVLLLGK